MPARCRRYEMYDTERIGAEARGKPRNDRRKAAAGLPQSKKGKAPTGIGAYFSTLMSLPD